MQVQPEAHATLQAYHCWPLKSLGPPAEPIAACKHWRVMCMTHRCWVLYPFYTCCTQCQLAGHSAKAAHVKAMLGRSRLCTVKCVTWRRRDAPAAQLAGDRPHGCLEGGDVCRTAEDEPGRAQQGNPYRCMLTTVPWGSDLGRAVGQRMNRDARNKAISVQPWRPWLLHLNASCLLGCTAARATAPSAADARSNRFSPVHMYS